MRGVNKAIIVGTLGKDVEIRYTADGTATTTLSVATNESWTDKNTGQQQERTEWHRIVLWGRLAEIAGQYLRKGSRCYFEGKIQTRKWQDQNGQDRYSTEIRAHEMQMLGGKSDGAPQQAAPAPQNQAQERDGGGGYASASGYDARKPDWPVGHYGEPPAYDDAPGFDDGLPF